MVFRQVGNDTDKLISKFGLLNKAFIDIKKDFQSGQGIRSLGNFVSKSDIENFQKFNSELKNGVSFHKAYNTNLSNSHTYVQKQAKAIRELHTQQSILSRQMRSGKIDQQEYKAQMAACDSQIQAITTQTGKLTLAQKTSAVASKAAGVAMNVAFNMGIMLVINAIITGITYLVNREKELIEKANESAKSLKEQNQGIEEYKNKITELKNALADETIKTLIEAYCIIDSFL